MHDIQTRLGQLRRPPLMVRAARIGAAGYDRDRDLARLLGVGVAPPPIVALRHLLSIEAEAEHARRARAAGYRAARHVEILIAIMGEAPCLAPAPAPASLPRPEASGIAALRLVT
ncbi:MAG: hypothetical protein H5U16_05990 [Roseovarius sp.]|nr:hypothetical protein [Roseovarius sp.]